MRPASAAVPRDPSYARPGRKPGGGGSWLASMAVAAADGSTELDRRLAEVDALRRRVLNVIPHALRTPITTFRGLTEALVHATDDEIRNDIGPALRRLAAQAEHLLDDML